MSSKVVWIPGILGSDLSVRDGGGGPEKPVWVDPLSLLSGGIVRLQLGPDGASPGPLAGGDQVVVTGIFDPAYGPLATFLTLVGYEVLRLGFDWRRDLVSVAALAWPTIAAWAGGAPVHLVAHSFGGLLARAIYGQAQAAGAGSQIAHIITIGTPHYGSMEAVRLFWRLPQLYQGLSILCGWGARNVQGAGQDWLDATLASMPAWYELLPWAGDGPLFHDHPDQASMIYQLSYYAGGNSHVMQSWLSLAPIVQRELAGWLPAGLVTSIVGTGWRTPLALNVPHPSNSDEGYTYTDDGDGLVTVAQASPPGVTIIEVGSQHALQPLDPVVWARLPLLIGM
jgi:PGAP1-like protein